LVPGYLNNSIISNVQNRNPNGKVIDARENAFNDVLISNVR
jgi:hypothetical protein